MPEEIRNPPDGTGTLFCPQPLDGQEQDTGSLREDGRPKTTYRSIINVTSFRYLVVEIDHGGEHLLRFLSFLAICQHRVAAIYTSGGKSVHALLRIDAGPQEADWHSIVEPMKRDLIELGADPAALTSLRLSRLPFCRRSEKLDPADKLRGNQVLLYLDDKPDGSPIFDRPKR